MGAWALRSTMASIPTRLTTTITRATGKTATIAIGCHTYTARARRKRTELPEAEWNRVWLDPGVTVAAAGTLRLPNRGNKGPAARADTAVVDVTALLVADLHRLPS